MPARHLPSAEAIEPGARMLKTSLAVALAWWLGTLIGEQRPLFAALGALVGMEPTIVGSLRRTLVQVVGTLGGVVLAYLVVNLLGVSWLAAGLAVLLGLWLGRWLGSPDRVGVELAVGALLVVGVASGDAWFGLTRLWEVVLGGMVATAINALILPPSYVDEVMTGLDRLADEIAAGLSDTAHEFVARPQHDGVAKTREGLLASRDTLHDVEESLRLGREALRLNPLLADQRAPLDRARQATDLYRRALQHATAMSRIVQHHAARSHAWVHGDLNAPSHLVTAADALARVIERYQAHVRSGRPEPLAEARDELGRSQAALQAFYEAADRERAADTAVQRLVDVAAFASELEHLAQADLAAALDGAPAAAAPSCPSSAAGDAATTP